MSFLSFHHLPRVVKDDSVWEAYTTRMKPLRLRSLKEDPKSFVSRYEAEVKEPLEFWVGRLKDTKAWSIVMIHSAEDLSDAGDILLRDDVKWVGFLVMIDRREVDGEVGGDSPKSQRETEAEIPDWYMAALWLSPEHRGNGNGQRLVEHGLQVARNADRANHVEGRSCMTQVVRGNERALSLYERIGFNITDPDSTFEKDGITQYAIELKIKL